LFIKESLSRDSVAPAVLHYSGPLGKIAMITRMIKSHTSIPTFHLPCF
jgi:hypothetical protein